MPGIGVIYNPRSRHNRRVPDAGARLARALGPHGLVRRADSIDALYRAAREFQELAIDVVAISGGDGTSCVTISGLLDVYAGRALPAIALLRGGTANALADSLDVPRERPERLLRRLAHRYAQRTQRPLTTVERHVMRVRGREARRRDSQHASLPAGAGIYGFLFGTGVVSNYLEELYASGPPSPLRAAQTLLRGIGSTLVQGPMIQRMARPFRGSAELDGTRWPERDYLAIAAGTIEQLGLGFKPFHRAQERPGTFHALGIYASPMDFVGQLANVWRGRPMQPGHSYEALATTMVLRSAAPTLDYTVDGDLYVCEGLLEVSVGPAVRMVMRGTREAPAGRGVGSRGEPARWPTP